MKKAIIYSIAALAMMMAACTSDETSTPRDADRQQGIPFSATITTGAPTRALTENASGTIDAAWATGEKVALIYGDKVDVMEVTKNDDGTATISGTLTGSPTEGSAVTVIYPASAVDATTKAVSITNNTPVDISAQLERIATQLQVKSVDGKTENVKNVRMTFSAGSKSFNPTTGLALSDTGYENTIGNTTTVGSLSSSRGYLFLTSDEQTMDVTIETLDADGNPIFSKTVENVPLQRNRKTKLTGAMYGASATAGSFQVNTTWLDEEDPIAF